MTDISLFTRVKVRCEEVGDCWIWKQGCSDSGMPIIGIKGKTQQVRRVIYAEEHGAVPEGLKITPRCGHKKCVSPKCLLAVSQKHALQSAAKRGVYSGAAKIIKTAMTIRARSKITDEIVQRIRESEGPSRIIAEATGVSLSYVKNIRSGNARREFIANPFSGLGTRP